MTLLLLEISKQARNYDLREGVKDKRAKSIPVRERNDPVQIPKKVVLSMCALKIRMSEYNA